jgi:hypothetical protein
VRPSATNIDTHADGDRDGPPDGYTDRDRNADPNAIAKYNPNRDRHPLRR